MFVLISSFSDWRSRIDALSRRNRARTSKISSRGRPCCIKSAIWATRSLMMVWCLVKASSARIPSKSLNSSMISLRNRAISCWGVSANLKWKFLVLHAMFKSNLSSYPLCNAEACNESARIISASLRLQVKQLLSKKYRSNGEPLAHSVRFDLLEIWTLDLQF